MEMERPDEVDIDEVIEQERDSRKTLIAVRKLIREIESIDPATFSPAEWREKAVGAMRVAELALEWGLAASKQLKTVVNRDFN